MCDIAARLTIPSVLDICCDETAMGSRHGHLVACFPKAQMPHVVRDDESLP
jgi:hypothetical protein